LTDALALSYCIPVNAFTEVSKPMNPREIKAKLILLGRHQSCIARQLGISQAAVSLTVHGHRRNPRIQRAIAKAIGVSVNQAFPKNHQRERIAA
jgi:lambda repressor-like predicted transcriptional regulator